MSWPMHEELAGHPIMRYTFYELPWGLCGSHVSMAFWGDRTRGDGRLTRIVEHGKQRSSLATLRGITPYWRALGCV